VPAEAGLADEMQLEVSQTITRMAAVLEKLDYLQGLGVNAIEFMPWTQWPGTGYNWGYEPQDFFAVAYPTLSIPPTMP